MINFSVVMVDLFIFFHFCTSPLSACFSFFPTSATRNVNQLPKLVTLTFFIEPQPTNLV